MKTLFWHSTGPKISAGNGTIEISDLNPEQQMRWRMSRWELFVTGWRMILASMS
jgi:hypothetical protein